MRGFRIGYCQGVDYRLKFTGKTDQLKEMLIFTILANFVYFPYISDRNLLILLIYFKVNLHIR